jgi:hypothetical protein
MLRIQDRQGPGKTRQHYNNHETTRLTFILLFLLILSYLSDAAL